VSANECRFEHPDIGERNGVRPEVMLAALPKRREVLEDFRRPSEHRPVAGVGQHPHESILRQRASRPPVSPLVVEPVMGNIVVDVIRVEEGDQQIYVEQRDPVHSSSLSSFTNFIVGRIAEGGRRGNRGTPFRTLEARTGASACRARSDKTLPALTPRTSASSFAA
jgi:hypothetical protein